MGSLNKSQPTVAVIPGTSFKPYLYALAKLLKSKGVDIKAIASFRFHLVEAAQAGIPLAHKNLDALLCGPVEESLTDALIDEDTAAFRRMFLHGDSYRLLYRRLVYWYRTLFREQGVDALLIFNGFKIYQRAAIRAAEMDSIRVLHIENGYLARTLQIDPKGINFGNSLLDRYIKNRSGIKACSYEELEIYAKNSICTDTLPAAYHPASSRGISWWWSVGLDLLVDPLLRPWLWRPKLFAHWGMKRRAGASYEKLGGQLPPRYILLVLQVELDTQHVLYSPLFQGMSAAMRLVCEARDEVAPGLPVVVRPHPVDPRPWKIMEQFEKLQDVIWDEVTPLEEAIEKAEVVATVNSSVGFQALMARKKVFALGQACYVLPDVCPGAVEMGSVAAALRAALDLDVDHPERMKFLTFVTKEYFVYDSWIHLTASGLENSARRVCQELGQAVDSPAAAMPLAAGS
jgi:capsule polysaccharide modification protein KpsS